MESNESIDGDERDRIGAEAREMLARSVLAGRPGLIGMSPRLRVEAERIGLTRCGSMGPEHWLG